MRAVEPAASGFVHHDFGAVHWERFGAGEPALLFVCADTIVDSQMWKGQVPWFARRHIVVTYDPRGNGRSSGTEDPAAFGDDEAVGDAVAVLDAAGVQRAVVIGLCTGAGIALVLAARRPERVHGVVAINPGLALTPRHPHHTAGRFDDVVDRDDGWAKENRHYWRRDWAGYSEFFFSQMFPEPHSTKQREDCVQWALGTTPEIMLAGWDCVAPTDRGDPLRACELCRRVRCPVLVINGDQDQCQPPARSHRVAELTGGDLVVLNGSGHLPNARDPVKVDLEISSFLGRLPAAR